MKKRSRSFSLIPIYASVLLLFLLSAMWGSKAVTVIAENAPLPNRTCVVIDAGHGGEDGGAVSCTGVLESKINLEIALRLEDLLHLLGIDTLMIRTTDRSVYTQGDTIAAKKVSDLKERVRIINETENALLISIHQNYFSDGRYYGAQVFYSPTDESSELAAKMQTALVQALNPESNRKSKQAEGIYLMEHIDCTGILIECGFLSNAEEEARLRSADYQKQLCTVIASTAAQFISLDAEKID